MAAEVAIRIKGVTCAATADVLRTISTRNNARTMRLSFRLTARCRKLAVHSLCGSLILTTSASAQSTAGLVGSVRDSLGGPVSLAQLSLSGVRTLSDSAGRFTMAGLPSGGATLLVRRLGFTPLDFKLELAAGRTDSVQLVLTMLPRELAEITSEASDRARARLTDFYRHRENGSGYYYDRKEIEQRRVQRISDLLRRLPGVRVGTDRTGRYVVRMSRSVGGRDCPPDFWIDGIRAPSLNVDDLPLVDVEALEIYKGPSGIPPEYLGRLGSPGCGAVVIWTRVP
jgi:hypothetical protein